MNKNKLLKSLVGTAALTISLSGVANTYALAAEADNAEGVNKPASNLVVDNKEDKSQTPDVERQDDGSFDVSFKDKDGNVTEKKNVQLDKTEEKPADEEEKPAEDEEEKPADEEEKPADEEEQPADEEEKPADEEEKPADEEEKPAEDEEEKPADEEVEKVGNEPRIVFSVKDGEPLKINVGSTWNPFNHAAAIDSEDGDLTDKIEYEGDVDVYTPGTYEVTYTVTDSDGNEVSEVLTVQVGESTEEEEEEGTKDDCNTCDNGGVKVDIDNENTLNGEGEGTTDEPDGEGEGEGTTEEPEVDNDEGDDKEPAEEPEVDNDEGDDKEPAEEPEDNGESDDDKSEDNNVTVVENDDNGKGSGEEVYDSSDVTKEQKQGDLPDTGVENTSNAGLIASIGAMFAAMGAFLFGRRKSSDKQ